MRRWCREAARRTIWHLDICVVFVVLDHVFDCVQFCLEVLSESFSDACLELMHWTNYQCDVWRCYGRDLHVNATMVFHPFSLHISSGRGISMYCTLPPAVRISLTARRVLLFWAKVSIGTTAMHNIFSPLLSRSPQPSAPSQAAVAISHQSATQFRSRSTAHHASDQASTPPVQVQHASNSPDQPPS